MPTKTVHVIGSYAAALVMTTAKVPQPGETVLGHSFRQTFGGKGSDIAVQASRLGSAVNYIGVVGDDAYGQEFQELLEAEGISKTALRITNELPTGIGFIIKDDFGENLISVDMGANALLSQEDVSSGLAGVQPGDVVIAQLEVPLPIALYGLKQAKEKGATTILNPAPAVNLADTDLSFIDVLTPNSSESKTITGISQDESFTTSVLTEALHPTGIKNILVTQGGDGLIIIERNNQNSLEVTGNIKPIPIDLVDSNGAGDSFNAGLAVGLLEGMDLHKAADFGSVVASIACENWETVPSYQSRDVVNQRLKKVGKL